MGRFLFDDDVKVKRTGATEQVAEHLRAMIAAGRLPQGERLPEVPLAEALGVSRNTLRDGIRVLMSEGLIEHELHRGAIVRVLTAADIADIYGIRRRLELEALATVPQAPDTVRRQATAALDACTKALEESDYMAFVEHELGFHAALVAHIGSPRLDRCFAQVVGELRLVFSSLSSDSSPKTSNAILSRYRKIYRAAERGDVATAQELLGAHLDRYEARLQKAVAEAAPIAARR
jgi:DNA-binding GntR family transcriptional regulator